jgi:hypothetical protein
MDISTLHRTLLQAYSVENLNKISLTLINLYKNQQFTILQKIADIISDFMIIEIDNNGKGFSKLMMLYHPDRAGIHLNDINKLANDNNLDGLLEYSHILKLERIEEIADSLDSYEDIDYSPVYEWDINISGFRIVNDNEKDDDSIIENSNRTKGFSFYDAIKIRVYGQTNIEFPTYYLEDYEEYELSAAEINDLDGIQYCIHTKNFDLSDNNIHDLSPLSELPLIEVLNLADNNISYIDALGYLHNLRNITLCNNTINDVSPLFELEKLEYADLSGNQVHPSQIAKLKDMGVTVVF